MAASVNTTGKDQTLVKQNDQYELKVTADGKASFTLNGATAVSGKTINDGKQHVVVGVKENNGMLKLMWMAVWKVRITRKATDTIR